MKVGVAHSIFAVAGAVAVIGLSAGVVYGAHVGDCDNNGTVSIGEVSRCGRIFSALTPLSNCPNCDRDGSGVVSIGEVSQAGLCFSDPNAPSCKVVTPPIGAATATATHTPPPTSTPTNPPPPTSTDTATPIPPTATFTVPNTATSTPTAVSSPSPTATQTLDDTPTPSETPTETPTPSETPTETSTAGETPAETETPTATATFPPTLTPTVSPTPTMASVCGNGFLESGETCTSCAADCVVHTCTATTPVRTFAVNYAVPSGPMVTGVTVLMGYRSDRVSLPGSGTGPAARVKNKPANAIAAINDLNYAIRVVLSRSVAFPPGRLFTVDFDSCQGATAPTAADFGCTVEGCSNSNGNIQGCTCTVTTP